MQWHWALGGISVITLMGCGATEEQLRSRAAFDLNCPEDRINVVEIDNRTRGVRGCNQQATYVESCQGPDGNLNCTWVLNSEGKRRRD